MPTVLPPFAFEISNSEQATVLLFALRVSRDGHGDREAVRLECLRLPELASSPYEAWEFLPANHKKRCLPFVEWSSSGRQNVTVHTARELCDSARVREFFSG